MAYSPEDQMRVANAIALYGEATRTCMASGQPSDVVWHAAMACSREAEAVLKLYANRRDDFNVGVWRILQREWFAYADAIAISVLETVRALQKGLSDAGNGR